jgi:hypothetical protein
VKLGQLRRGKPERVKRGRVKKCIKIKMLMRLLHNRGLEDLEK